MSNSISDLPLQPKPTAAYLHVPFCHRRCPYCNFTVVADRQDWMERYLDAVMVELSLVNTARPMNTIFIGGGTPTLLPYDLLRRLLDSIAHWLPMDTPGGEWTIEANPNDVSDELCEMLRQSGVNRVSLGGQSFQDSKLSMLGRDHCGGQLQQAIRIASQWFDEVSVDLIFGVPGETIDDWLSDLACAVALPITHVSTYGLTYEKGARYWSRLQRGDIVAVSEEVELEMYMTAIEHLSEAGFEHYEVSNFSLPGSSCRHNETYWNGEPWYAFGPGAASFVTGVRRVNHRSTGTYLKRIEAGESPVAEEEALDWETWTRERFVFGMRKRKGVQWESLVNVGKGETIETIQSQINLHIQDGWLEWCDGCIRMTTKALPVSDGLWKDYL
jgi:oxygen-independent coproporphyrinogen III oxidase